MGVEDKTTISQLKSHKKRWSQKDLLERIVARHFNIFESLSGIWPSWVVDSLEDKDISGSLVELNKHLKKLDWMAKIFPEEPYVLKILPVPKGLFILGRKQFLLFWILAFFSAWGMGIEWISNHQTDTSLTNYTTLYRSFVYYAIPLIGTLLISNIVQIYLAKKNDIRIGGMIPILFPIPLAIWPFGIIAIPSHPRRDSICWPSTKKMISVCLSGPAVILIFGALFLSLGIFFTPNMIDQLNSQPYKTNPPLIIELIFSLVPEKYIDGMGLYWLHPLGLAGLALTLIGWINLLPLPTLAGGRILAGLIGLDEMSKVGTQISLMVLILILGLSYGFLEQSSIWTFIIIGGLMLLFTYGTDQKLPIILDETKSINDGVSKNFTSIFIIFLLLLLPAKMPLEPVEDWDSEINIELDDLYVFNDINEIKFSISNPSLLPKEIKIRAWMETAQTIDFDMQCSQNELIEDCEVIEINPHSSIEIMFKSINNITPNQSVEVILLFDYLGLKEYHQITFLSDTQIQSLIPRWEFNEDLIKPEICTNLTNNGDEIQINISNYWKNKETSNALKTGNQRFCLVGGAGFMLSKNKNISNPSISYVVNGTNYSIDFLATQTNKLLLSPNYGWNFTDLNANYYPFISNSELEISETLSELCSNNTAYPLMLNTENFVWNATSSNSRKFLPNLDNKTLVVKLPKSGYLKKCDRENPVNSDNYIIKQGPQILVNGTESEIIWGHIPIWDLINCTNCENHFSEEFNITIYAINENVSISTRFHGDVIPWKLNLDESKRLITAENETEINIDIDFYDEKLFLMIWMDYDSNNLEIHFSAWSEVY